AAEKTRADLAAKAAKEAELRAKEQEGQAKTLREQMEKLTRDLSHAKEDARLAAKAQADSLADKERLNALQAQQIAALTKENEACREQAAAAKEVQAQADELHRSLEAAEQARRQAEAQVEKLRRALEEKEQEMKARTNALEEQYTHEKRMLLMKAENERQSAVLTVKSEYAARIESLQEKYMEKLAATYHAEKQKQSDAQAPAEEGKAADPE
ncbi:hypothetical protein, partial [Mitsuokella multacida]